jgi:hypothetical protein
MVKSSIIKFVLCQIYANNILKYGGETWTLKEQNKSRITAVEITFLRKTIKYTLPDHKRNQDIMKELKTQPVLEKINDYKHKWMQHVRRMGRSWLPYAITKYQQNTKWLNWDHNGPQA